MLERVEEARAVGEIETKEQALEMASGFLKNMAGKNMPRQAMPKTPRNGSV